MLLDEIYERAESEGIEIDEIRTRKISAMSFPDGWIAVDRTKFESEATFKTALAHEIGHVETGSFYRIETPLYTKEKCEYKANKKAVQMLITLSELIEDYLKAYPLRSKLNHAQSIVPYNRLKTALGTFRLSSIREVDLQRFLNSLKDYSASTISKQMQVAKAIHLSKSHWRIIWLMYITRIVNTTKKAK